MNSVSIAGRIATDLEMKRMSANNSSLLSFTVAVTRDYRDRTTGEYESDFIRCVAYGQQAVNIEKYFGKGDQIIIAGRISTGSYEKDGVKHYTTDVIVDRFDFGQKARGRAEEVPVPEPKFEEVNDDDALPF